MRSPLLVDDISNVMLLCHDHHVLIDEEKPDEHSEELLLEFKKRHEDRIRIQTGVMEDKATHILRYGASIGTHEVSIDLSTAYSTVMPEYYPASFDPIDIQVTGSRLDDTQDDFWTFNVENLKRHFDSYVSGKIETHQIKHLSVFALAPQPLLIELGRLLCDILPAEIFQPHREPKTWRWLDEGKGISLRTERPENTSGIPVLKLDLSATVNNERIHKVLGKDIAIWSIAADDPNNDIIRCREDLTAVRRRLRRIYDQIKAVHGEDAILHVFPVVPASAAIEIGRVWMPKADLPMKIYDQNRNRGGFEHAIDIGKTY